MKYEYIMSKNVIITIPVFKQHLNTVEQKSFLQCLRILHKHDISIFTHNELDLSEYYQLALQTGKNFSVAYFDKNYFSSVAGYNRLMLSKDFYTYYASTYKYILIYQLDAWIFSDELEKWCLQDYDYIGAPSMFIKKDPKQSFKYWSVGNGGLSLRKCEYCLKVLSIPEKKTLIPLHGLIQMAYTLRMKLAIPFKIFGFQNSLMYFKKKGINEDQIFSYYMQHSSYSVNLPSVDKALEFAFESHPSYSYKRIGNKLPFGCHAFIKHEYETFWKQFINI